MAEQRLAPGTLVKFKPIVDLDNLSLTLVELDSGSFRVTGHYSPLERNPVGIYLDDADSVGIGIFLFDDKTCYIGKCYLKPAK